MTTNKHIHHVRFTIAGAARSGVTCAKLLKKFGAQIFLTDEKKISSQNEKILQDLGVDYEHSGHSIDKILQNTDVLVISPGILLSSPLVIAAKLHHILVVSEVEVACWCMPEHVVCVGITGTNGKSTTTHYLASLLQLKENAIACGNIGLPVSEVVLNLLEKKSQIKYLVIELSSYQLETIFSLKPLCTIFLNLQNDHLARYETMEEYLKAKWRLVLLTHPDGLAIIEENVLEQAIKLGLSLPQCKTIIIKKSVMPAQKSVMPAQAGIQKNTLNLEILNSFTQAISLPIAQYKGLKNLHWHELLPLSNYTTAQIDYNAEFNSANIYFINKDKRSAQTWNIKNSCLNGVHNIFNVLAASLSAEFLNLSQNTILKQWEKETTQYIHLAHRLETIGKENQIFIDANKKKKKVLIINDSKATNIESTLVALKSFQNPIKLLLGGEPKGDSYLPISQLANKEKITIYPFGKAASIISKELNSIMDVITPTFPNMLSAAQAALQEAQNGDIILLSPACSSFDEFKDYEHRGNVFRTWAISCSEENI